ncbi:MAG TPA: ABC transporter substrate-binding protein [Dehalococcoidia bacterium]|nr:ABC transporter substrate-binding protein [Dehalococcoidia bacterium]
MTGSYWSNVLGQRMHRRRALVATGGVAAAAAFLAGCGGGDGSSDSKSDKSSLVTKPTEIAPAQAKRGGTLRVRATGDPATLDPAGAINPLNPPARIAYNTLVRIGHGVLKWPENTIIPDVAESWEVAPGGLQITMKLRQNVKWHNKPPVNGRTLDAADVLAAWDRFSRRNVYRTGVVNSVNPDAPVLSLTSPDARTIVIKLKEPLVYALDLFASNPGSHSGSMLLLPKETDNGFTPGTDMIGAGPYMMSKYEPSIGFTMKRHADYYDQSWGFLDTIEFPVVVETAATLAQLKAGNIHYFTPNADDVLRVKSEEPKLLLYDTDIPNTTNVLTFGLLPAGKSPFLDERVRQAVSMSWDRDLFIDTFYNVDKFTSNGLPVETRWNTSISSLWDGWWLDPKGKDFGANAKNYQHNIAEAKKLLAAAGFPNGLQNVLSNHITTNELPNLAKYADVLDGMASEIGIASKINPVDYAKEYTPNYRDGHGQYEGWGYVTTAGGTGVGPVGTLANQYWSKGGAAFAGFSTSRQNDQSGDPKLNDMIVKARAELDTEKRRALVYELQRYLAQKIYALMIPGVATGFTFGWPALGNYRVYRGFQVWDQYRLFMDDTKPPFKS